MQIFIYSFYFEFRVVFGLLLLGVVFNGALLIHDFENMSKLLRELKAKKAIMSLKSADIFFIFS